jgi:hypothetical protein
MPVRQQALHHAAEGHGDAVDLRRVGFRNDRNMERARHAELN